MRVACFPANVCIEWREPLRKVTRVSSTRVLVVEDEPRSRGALHEYLTLHGLDVRSTANCREAIEVGRMFRPHVLLCDWWLDDSQDGVDVARALVGAVDGLKILFMTGLPVNDLEPVCDGLPVRAVFKKPLRLSVVKAAIEDIAASRF